MGPGFGILSQNGLLANDRAAGFLMKPEQN